MADDMNPLLSLDARYYTDPKIFDIESSGLFASSWQFAGHASQLQNPGDYFTFEMAGESLFCVLDRDGAINAFYNVCQHRAHQLVEGSGRAPVITCPYHAWSYDLQGRLRAGPNIKAVEGFRREEICLTSVPIENFCGFLFVNLDPDARPMDEWFPGVRAELAAGKELDMTQEQKLRDKPKRAPMIIVALAKLSDHEKVPAIEQEYSAAAAVQAMSLAAYAQELGSMWRTGGKAYDATVRQGLGVAANEKIVGFLYLGTPGGPLKGLVEQRSQDFMQKWPS